MREALSIGPYLAQGWKRFAAAMAVFPALALMPATPAYSSNLIYTPVNPNFGGHPLNSNQLLGVANGINKFTAPPQTPATVAAASASQAQQFLRQLQSRLLSSLASNVTEAIFGQNPQDHGEVIFGDQTIIFDRGLDSVEISILDSATGETTRISVPLLVTGP